ncbi:hypothetical protein [Marimonas lutisalis]|uniref:hypothetical protein n=1 Tax=Marimonas lutisalis TaxID=2545756 RepID=UPI0010F60B2B|nr:hypothetical protein [Marimonas lutisalis]
MGPPIKTMIHEGKPEGRLVHLRDGSHSRYYIVPDDGREIREISLTEVRPYPAYDAMDRLAKILKKPIDQILAVE